MIIHDRQIKKFIKQSATAVLVFTAVFGGEFIYQNHLKSDIEKTKAINAAGANSKLPAKKIKSL